MGLLLNLVVSLQDAVFAKVKIETKELEDGETVRPSFLSIYGGLIKMCLDYTRPPFLFL